MTDARDRSNLREAFDPDTTRGKLAIVTALLVLIGPSLATFVSSVFLLLLGAALALSLLSVARAQGEGSTVLARTGYAMAANGVLLIVGLFIVGILGDFFLSPREGLVTASVGAGFTTVHILLGIGLLVVDNYRHVRRSDI